MKSSGTIIWFLAKFVFLTVLLSGSLISVGGFFSHSSMFSFHYGLTNAFWTLFSGGAIYLYFKIGNIAEWPISHIANKDNDSSLRRKVFLTMIGITVVLHFFVMYGNSEFYTLVVVPALCFFSAVGLVLYHHNKPIEQKNTSQFYRDFRNEEYSGRNNSYSVLFTGDSVQPENLTSHGSASWISDERKNSLTDIVDEKPTFKGLWIGGGFFHHKEGNLVSVAPPGTGKGAALIIPNLLWERNYNHSFVVFDPKGTNACITADYQRRQGNKVIIIDPMNLQKANRAKHGVDPASFNPLDHITDDIFNGSAQIANLLIPDDPNGEKFWNQEARNLVQAIIMHIMTDDSYIGRRNLVTFYKIMLTANFFTLLSEMVESTAEGGVISDLASGLAEVLSSTEQTFTSIKNVANASIKWLSNPALQNCMQKSDFSPNDLDKGGISLYICQPIQNKEGFATFSRLIIGFCLRANSKPAAKPKAWVYYLLDEFPTMGIFPEVIECLAYSREYRMRLWIFAQSLSQLDQIYKTEGRNQILGNARVLQAFGVTDHVTQEYISKRIGNKTVKVYTQSTSTGSSNSSGSGSQGSYSNSKGSSQSTSNNESFHGKPLIEPNDVQYDPSIITISEWGPMRLSRWQYWQHLGNDPVAEKYRSLFKMRAAKNPNIESDEEFEEGENMQDQPVYGPEGGSQFTMGR